MKRIPAIFNIILLTLMLFGCDKTEDVHVVFSGENVIADKAGGDLIHYLSDIYPDNRFIVSHQVKENGKSIVLLLNDAIRDMNDEAYSVKGTDSLLTITGRTPRALLNGVYGLMEEMGAGFYLSFESLPGKRNRIDLSLYNFSDAPEIDERIVFNWHNFLSGCSAWDLTEWRSWIDQSSKMRFNTLMVHAYGNNPMFTYTFNGREKRTSPLPSTRGGRDYGTHDLNDVRRLYGGELFDHPVFGAEVAMEVTEYHAAEVQQMMSQAFNHAKSRGMKICFAVDIDTNPANPQELIMLLPPSARFSLPLKRNDYSGRFYDATFWLANPDTPEGYAFYRGQVKALLDTYPQLDQIALWMRHKGSFEWLSLELEQLPEPWQKEYNQLMEEHPESADWEYGPGRFALGKVIAAWQQILKDFGRQDIVLRVGSWTFDWMEACDLYFPEGLGFIGLDYNVLHGPPDIDLPEQQQRLLQISQRRHVTPVFWAHHDDGAIMGRPYAPVEMLTDKLKKSGAGGVGIIHWTTWPLDSYFKNTALQVWKRTSNQDYKTTLSKMAVDLFGPAQVEKTAEYLHDWAVTAPMIGRETREWFIDHAYTDQETREVTEGCQRRLAILEALKWRSFSDQGRRYINYFKGMEQVNSGFYETENAYQNSLLLLSEGEVEKALEAIKKCHPEQIITQFAALSAEKGVTKGEQGLLISLNLAWLPYIENQRQALGEKPIRYNFAPSNHPKFGQGVLRTSFFVDEEKNIWRNLGAVETGAEAYEVHREELDADVKQDDGYDGFREISLSGIRSDSVIQIEIKPFMADLPPIGPTKPLMAETIIPGKYDLYLVFHPSLNDEFAEQSQKIAVFHSSVSQVLTEDQWVRESKFGGGHAPVVKRYALNFLEEGKVIIELTPIRGKAHICGAVLQSAGVMSGS